MRPIILNAIMIMSLLLLLLFGVVHDDDDDDDDERYVMIEINAWRKRMNDVEKRLKGLPMRRMWSCRDAMWAKGVNADGGDGCSSRMEIIGRSKRVTSIQTYFMVIKEIGVSMF